MGVKTPVFKLTANDKDVTTSFQSRLIDLSITDQRGFESDSLTINVHDVDAAIVWPKRGGILQIWLGYAGDPLYDHGKYVVDEITHEGPPDKMTIQAKAPDLLAKFKGTKTRAFHKTKLGTVIEKLAADNKLPFAISPTLAAKTLDHIDQTQESDIHLLTRLGERYGAVAKVADGKLIFTEAGKATSVSGKPLPTFKITRDMIDTHHYTQQTRGDFTGVEATWHDVKKAKKRKATHSKSGSQVMNEEETAGSTDNVKRLKQSYPDEATAKAAAEAEWKRLQRAKETLELDIKDALPGLRAETKVPVSGIRQPIDGDWIATEVTHEFSPTSGLTTKVKLERPDDYFNNDDNN